MAFKNTDGAVYFYVYNLQGDVVQLLDSSRNVVGEYVYGPYGYLENSSSLTTVAKANPFRYRGYYYDSENGYYYLNARYYYPVFGRFISADAIIAQTSDFTGCNVFAYCKDNPINYCDYSGLWTVGIFVSANANYASGAMGAIGFVCDGYGNYEFQTSYAATFVNDTISVGLFDIGAGITLQITDRDTVYDLHGHSKVFGLSYGDVYCGGLDIISFNDFASVNGFQINAGVGVGPDMHFMDTDTNAISKKEIKNNRVITQKKKYKRNNNVKVSLIRSSFNTSYGKNKMTAVLK